MKKISAFLACVALAAIVVATLTACVPSDLEKAKEKLKDAGYATVSFQASHKGLQGTILATKGLDASINAYFFKDAKSAKAALKKIEDDNKDGKGNESGIKSKGKWIYFGTEQAVKDFEK